MKLPIAFWLRRWWLLGGMLVAVGCRQEMSNQPGHKPFRASSFFADGMAARSLPTGTIPRGFLRTNEGFYTGQIGTNLLDQIPLPVDDALLRRGRERFEIYCSLCHEDNGDGNGRIVQHGFPRPPSFQVARLRQAPVGHFYQVITYGYGVMYSYATRVAVNDRWAIAAYIRTLQGRPPGKEMER
ncbi:MAG: cytochrome c [Verrucomicrobiota bacterium]